MARGRVSTRRGLNMEPGAAIERRLARTYARIDRAALDELRGNLAPVLAAFDPGAVGALLRDVQNAVDLALPDDEIALAARRAAKSQDDMARKAFFPALAAATGFAISSSDAPGGRGVKPPRRIRPKDPRLVPRLNFGPQILSNTFVDSNVALISTLRSGVAEGVRDAVVRARVLGVPDPDDLARRLLKEWTAKGVPTRIPIRRLKNNGEPVLLSAKKHARMIARDQLGSLNGQLARVRQTAAGITSFVWGRTSAANPREEHLDLVGQTFLWSTGADGIWPGSEINCECSARALVDRDQVLADGDFVNLDSPEVRGTLFTERDITLLNPGPGALL